MLYVIAALLLVIIALQINAAVIQANHGKFFVEASSILDPGRPRRTSRAGNQGRPGVLPAGGQFTGFTMTARLRAWAGRTFLDPEPTLRQLRQFEIAVVQADLPDRVRRLRTNGLKLDREARLACIFASGMQAV